MKRILLLIILFIFIYSCKQVDFVAPSGATLNILANPNIVAPNGGVSEITVIGQRASGAPLADGTTIYFTVNIGRVEPYKVETAGGIAKAKFISDSRSGKATVTASSGAAEAVSVDITVGTEGLGSIELQANPSVLPKGGGTSEITARVLDTTGSPMPNVPVIFSTTVGTLQSSGKAKYTDKQGIAKDKLTTTLKATVTATAGSLSQTVDVQVGLCDVCQEPVASFVYSPTNPYAGQKVNFDAGASYDNDGVIVRYEWNFGDGKTGSGVRTSHRYSTGGQTFVVLLKVYDNTGLYGTTSASIYIASQQCNPVPAFGVRDSDGDGFFEVDEPLTFDASASSDPCGILTYKWDFDGDGTDDSATTNPVTTHTYSSSSTTPPKTYNVRLTIQNSQNQTASVINSILIVQQQ